jgi:EAL domain-containing protein (putative c-di-GMP-specific phosphodiesterase class I)
MYQAKRAGGAQWVRVSHEISSMANQASEIELALRRALKSGNLQVQYQPQMTIDGSFHSLEALLRSSEPVLRATPTDRMISIAEESGLIVALGNWVLEEVCRQCRAWIDEGFAPTRIAVNVSPMQLMRFDFSRQVAKLLAQYDLSAKMLEFEVTESTVMPDRRSDAVHQIATLARMGIRFSVDDFGTGYSSLGRLHQLPVESLKIDQSFTRHLAELNGTFPTVEAIIVLAHTFGMKVVAEGVETEEQLALLRSLGCDRLQGYLFSRPLSAEATTAMLRSLEENAVQQSVA